MEHDGCVRCKYENESPDSKYCMGCKQNAIDKYTPMTNADKIRSMSDEEMAEFLEVNISNGSEKYLCADYGSGCYYSCKRKHICEEDVSKLYLEWLQSEVKEGE